MLLLYGHYAPMHVHAVKKERRQVNKIFFGLKKYGIYGCHKKQGDKTGMTYCM